MDFKKEDIESWVKEPIESFTSGEGTNKGDNVASEILRIQVKTISGKEHTLVYKRFPETIEGQGNFAVEMKIFWKENRFYETIAPAIESSVAQRLLQINSSNQKLTLPIPKFYAGFNNDQDDYVCLGDLRPEGFKMPDKKIGLDLAQMTLAMSKIGEFHALSYFYLREAGEGIFQDGLNNLFFVKQWLVPSDTGDAEVEKAQRAGLSGIITETYKNSIELVREHGLGPDREKLAFRMLGKENVTLNKAYQITSSTTSNTDGKYFPLIIHGDFWLNNVLFSYDEEGQPKDMKIVDFQFTRRGNIYEDLNYFVFTSTTAVFRKGNLVRTLQAYYDSFAKTLSQLKCPLPVGFTRGKFIDGFFENIVPAYLFLAFALPLQVGAEGEDPEVSADLPSRLRWKMERSPLAILRMEEAAREMIDMGFL